MRRGHIFPLACLLHLVVVVVVFNMSVCPRIFEARALLVSLLCMERRPFVSPFQLFEDCLRDWGEPTRAGRVHPSIHAHAYITTHKTTQQNNISMSTVHEEQEKLDLGLCGVDMDQTFRG